MVEAIPLIQGDVLKNIGSPPVGARLFDVHDGALSSTLNELEQSEERYIPLVSLEVAFRIQRDHPRLAQSLVFAPQRLAMHLVVAVMGQFLLNEEHLFVTWGQLLKMLPALKTGLGNELFVRPNSALKAFTGFSGSAERLVEEHRALSQIENVPNDELCLVARAREVDPIEWRCWVVDGEVVTFAPYSWEDVELPKEPPADVMTFAATAARATEAIESAVVMDVGTASGLGPRVLELNPLSTSGLYDGVDIARLVKAVSALFAWAAG